MINCKSVEDAIEMFEECDKKNMCNCFNKNPSLLCGNAWTCSIIKHYEDIFNDSPIDRPEPRYVKHLKLKIVNRGRVERKLNE